MLKLYLVRHGWTAWHGEGRVAGWSPVPLDAQGQAEAEAAGRWLADHCRDRPSALVSSPVVRARQTAEAIARAFQPALTPQLEEAIAETRLPEWEGRMATDIEANDHRWPKFFDGPADFRFPGGETVREVQGRVVAAVDGLRRRPGRGEIILVAHADPIRSLIAYHLGMDANHLYRLRVETGSISLLTLPDPQSTSRFPRPRLEFLNLKERSHQGLEGQQDDV
jgi:probable phosphoglycerate mutase